MSTIPFPTYSGTTRRDAARLLDAMLPHDPDDSHPTLGDFVKAAKREELLSLAGRTNGTVAKILLAAANGPDFWTPKLCAMDCGRPATHAPAWEPTAGAAYCWQCDSDGPAVPEVELLKGLWVLASREELLADLQALLALPDCTLCAGSSPIAMMKAVLNQ